MKINFKRQSKAILSNCAITKNNDGTIDVIGNLKVKFPIEYLPKIRNLIGNFNCNNNQYITSLIGTPKHVSGNFYCNNCNSLTTLEGAPQTIGGNFFCAECNKLSSINDKNNKCSRQHIQ